MSEATVSLEQLERIAATLDGQIKAFRGRTEGRDLSRNERKALEELENEHRAVIESIDTHKAAESRERTVANVINGDHKVIRTFTENGESRMNDTTGKPAESREVSEFRAAMREQRNFTTASTAAGLAVVPEPLTADLADKARAENPILSVATHFRLEGGNSSMHLPYKAAHGDATISADYTTARTTLNTTATFGSKDLVCVDYFSIQQAERHWLQSTPGSEDLVTRWVIEDLFDKYANDVALGDGTGNAAGLFTAGAVAYYSNIVYTGASATITAASFVDALTGMKPRHRSAAKWLMSADAIAAAMLLDAPNTSSTVPLVQIGQDGVMRILGKEVLECTDAPEVAADSISIALLSPEGYATGTHFGPEVSVDMFTAVPNVKFNGLARLGGQFWNPEGAALIVAGVEPV